MSSVDESPLSRDRVASVLQERETEELRFRSALITSATLHVGTLIGMLVIPLMIPRQMVQLEYTPVQVVELAPAPAPAPVEEPAVEPEPVEPEPEEVAPDNAEELRREQERREKEKEEEERRKAEEEARRRAAEEARRRAEEEARRKREEEEARRRQPQSASRRTEPDRELPQTAVGDARIGVQGGSRAQGLTEEEFGQFWYLDQMINLIGARWSPPARGRYANERIVVVSFRIDRRGRLIEGPAVVTGSGDAIYDRAAVRAVRNTAPFPPLPVQYPNDTLGVHLAFRQ